MMYLGVGCAKHDALEHRGGPDALLLYLYYEAIDLFFVYSFAHSFAYLMLYFFTHLSPRVSKFVATTARSTAVVVHTARHRRARAELLLLLGLLAERAIPSHDADHSSLEGRVRPRKQGALPSAGRGAAECLCRLGSGRLLQQNASSSFVHGYHCCAAGRSCCKAPQRCCIAGAHNVSKSRGQVRAPPSPSLRARRAKRAASRAPSRMDEIIAVTLAVLFAAAFVACVNLAFPCRAGRDAI